MRFERQSVVLNAAMLASLAAVVTGAASHFVPGSRPGFLVLACVLVALEASAVHRALREQQLWTNEILRYLVPELVVMFVLMRVATTLSFGTSTLAADLARWLYDPLTIFDEVFALALLAGFLIGLMTHVAMQKFALLAPRSFETGAVPVERSLSAAVAEERAGAIRHISSRFISGGVLLLFVLALEAFSVERVLGSVRAISPLSAFGALGYLVSGFLLYSQARLALLRVRWLQEGAHISEGVTRRWNRTSWLIVVGVIVLALLLPRSYGMGLLDTIRALLGVLAYVLILLSYVVLWIFGLVALLPAWLLSLFAPEATGGPPPAAPQFTPPPVPPAVERSPNLFAAVVFWVCMLLLVSYALWIVTQRHPWLAHNLFSRGPLARLLRWLRLFWRDTSSWAGQAARTLQARLQQPAVRAQRARRLLRLARLAPRDLVRYFYRSTLRRASQHGLPRRPGQTPYEYQEVLRTRLPEAQEDIVVLTDAFVQAQYSPRMVDDTDVRAIRGPWQRVRRRLRALRKRPV